ncbi:MAG TPA: hypothetical protein VNK04_05135 [Gemmataceae bacterium]|jgi:hypothetical protein|nr:hypothetical protein [Gemmataceae bacterium]
MKVRLDKGFILRLYCYSYQAERSIHYALGREWAELLNYYRGERFDGVRSVADYLNKLVARNGLEGLVRTAKERLPHAVPPGPVRELFVHLYRFLVGRWVARWQKRWSFSDQELCFMAATLNGLVRVLESATRPDPQDLISLRLDLCWCRSMIEDRCYGLLEIKRAREIEHYWQEDRITPVKLTDILGESLQEQPSTRRSA